MTPPESPSREALALLDAAACGLIQTDDVGTFLRVNRTFCKWVGYAPEALVGHRRLQDLLTVGGRIYRETHWLPLLHMQGCVSEVKLEIVHRDGAPIPMVVNALRHAHCGAMVHEIAAYVARDRDMYERELVLSRRRLEELVAETTRLHAEAKDRAVFAEQMIGIVSHDLRNPLASIVLGGAVLASEESSERARRTLDQISRSAERANRLVADLLDFTQARLGKGLAVTVAPFDLHEAVAQVVDELALAYPHRTLRHVRLGEGICSADVNRLGQLVGNLVSNAIAYGTPGGAVTVTSSVEATSFAIAVHNEGEAIPEEAQARLFEPMTRGSHPVMAARSVGLGLFIVREIGRAHGGSARVHSTDAEGTTFMVTFPRA